MKINFKFTNLEVDLSYPFSNKKSKEWWFSNCIPSIPLDAKEEDLTDSQKKSLIKLAIYEGQIDSESLCNMDSELIEIIK